MWTRWGWPMLLGAGVGVAQIVPDASFGLEDRISPNGLGIPHWHVSGQGQVPQILSDKVILTPLYPGNTRGALWSETAVSQRTWLAELEFRASGPDGGSGNLQVWFTKGGREGVAASSVYTVERFDGFVLTIDQYGGRGGTIRGFMNEGNVDFRTHHSVDSLAFGHCDYSYRNIGRLSQLQIKQTSSAFEVVIDGRPCFATEKIQMPAGYTFGITAGSGESPDSFEVNKFRLSIIDAPPVQQQQPPPPIQQPRDTPASTLQSSEAQFEDLHNRLQTLAHAIERIDSSLTQLHVAQDSRHNDASRSAASPQNINRIMEQTDKIDRLEKGVEAALSHLVRLQGSVRDSHKSISEVLPAHVSDIMTAHKPRMGSLISMFVVIQVVLVLAYIIYKRRSKQGPKKYL